MSMDGAPPTGSSGPPMAEVKTGPDGEIIGEPPKPNMQHIAAQKRLQQTQAQVDEVVGLMQVNVEKVLERDHLLSELDHRAEKLEDGASQFEKQAKSLKNKFWLENLKMMLSLGVVGLIIIGLLWYKYGSSSSDTTTVVVLPTQSSGQQSTAISTVATTLSSVLTNPTVATTILPSSTSVVTSTTTAVTTKLPTSTSTTVTTKLPTSTSTTDTTKLPTSTSTTVTTTTSTQSSEKKSPADPLPKSTTASQKTS